MANNIGQMAADASDTAKREADKRKVAVAISLIVKQTYSTLKDLCLPNLPAEKTYDQLTEILKGYYKLKVLEVAESYRFHHTLQSENETVTEYANKLKRLAVNCNFGRYLTRALRDQFVGGVKSQATKKKLLSEDRTFEQALKVAQADELAEKESKQLQFNSNLSAKVQAVHSVPKKSSLTHPVNKQHVAITGKTHAKFCFRCGSSQHLADKCSHSTSVCNFCKKKGHIAKVCFKKKKEGSRHTTHLVTATATQEVNTNEGNGDNPDRFALHMRSVKSSDSPTPTPPLYKLSVTVDNKEFPMEIDTGSAVTLLSATDFSSAYCQAKW